MKVEREQWANRPFARQRVLFEQPADIAAAATVHTRLLAQYNKEHPPDDAAAAADATCRQKQPPDDASGQQKCSPDGTNNKQQYDPPVDSSTKHKPSHNDASSRLKQKHPPDDATNCDERSSNNHSVRRHPLDGDSGDTTEHCADCHGDRDKEPPDQHHQLSPSDASHKQIKRTKVRARFIRSFMYGVSNFMLKLEAYTYMSTQHYMQTQCECVLGTFISVAVKFNYAVTAARSLVCFDVMGLSTDVRT